MAEPSEIVVEQEHTEEANIQEDAVSININIHNMLRSGQKSPDQPCIFKVPNYLSQGNKEAYEPQVISIGPYHRNNNGLEAGEHLKIQFFQKFLKERQDDDVSVYFKEMRELEVEARNCYAADSLNGLDSEDFVKLLLFDGVFIVQTIRLFFKQTVPTGLNAALRHDMLLVENQLPYFVLLKLYGMIESEAEDKRKNSMIESEAEDKRKNNMIESEADKRKNSMIESEAEDKRKKFAEAILVMFEDVVPGERLGKGDRNMLGADFKHLFDFVYHYWDPSIPDSIPEMKFHEKNPTSCIGHLPSCWRKYYCHSESNEFKFRVTKLQEDGIKFKLLEDSESVFDIRFENGTLSIPEIIIGKYTGRFLRNLVAYEEMVLEDGDLKFVTDYVILMDRLIDTPNDVEILCKEGIIFNMLVDEKAVATMFNDLGQGIFFHYFPDSYIEVLADIQDYCNHPLNKHCRRRGKRWIVNLKQNYFNSPWSLISVLAATVLLILTFLQTIFSAK